MSLPSLPPITHLPTLPTTHRASILDALFERSVPLHTLSVSLLQTPYPSYAALIDAIGAQLRTLAAAPSTSDTQWLDQILGAHPRLGEPRQETVSAASRAEQRGLSEGEGGRLRALNEEYEATFPGLRYVVFVNGRPRSVIMEDMRSRIDRGDIKLEREEAIKAMCEIATDRAAKLQQE